MTKTHGNQFQSGLPDLYVCHASYAPRWIECKIRNRSFTQAQKKLFPVWFSCNVPIYVAEGVDWRGAKGTEGYRSLHDFVDRVLMGKPNGVYYFSNLRRLHL